VHACLQASRAAESQILFGSRDKSRRKLEEKIIEALGRPGWLESVSVGEDGRAVLVILADPSAPEAAEARRIEAEGKVELVAGVKSVSSVLTAERTASAPAKEVHLSHSPASRRVRKGARLSDEAMQQGNVAASTPKSSIPGISRILVVASAKGGVGKSTVSVNLAAAMAKAGMKVGLMDADIYGPSIPTMLGTVDAQPATSPDTGKLQPVEAFGLKTLSIGYLTDPDSPMIWRGPIVMSAITQMLNDAEWGTPDDPLDVLIIDTPPGTGDAQLTIAQRVPVTAALIVTTPQEVALADVRRGAAMFAKTEVPVLGIVETMSWFEDPTGNRHYLMGQGGGAATANALGLPLLAELPMLQAIREGGDAGKPAALSDETTGQLFHELARHVAIELDSLMAKPEPEIVFED
jgi:ATP-binding protein involved in chromosome partitioning